MSEVCCRDCGAAYAGLGLDMVLPDQQWKAICPEDGILCANCICQRATKYGGTVVLAWVDQIDWALVERGGRMTASMANLERVRQFIEDKVVTNQRADGFSVIRK